MARASQLIWIGSGKFAVDRVPPGAAAVRRMKIRLRIRFPTRGSVTVCVPVETDLMNSDQYCVVPTRGGTIACGRPAISVSFGCVHASRYARNRYVLFVAVPTALRIVASAATVN